MERKLEDGAGAGGDDIPDTELHTPLNVKPERGERERREGAEQGWNGGFVRDWAKLTQVTLATKATGNIYNHCTLFYYL